MAETITKSGLVLGLASLALLASCYSSEETEEGVDACCDSGPDVTFDTILNDVLPGDPPAEDVRPDGPDMADVPVDTLIEDVNPVDPPPDDVPPDEPPPDDCQVVSYFQCGFMALCVDGVVTAEWHEHVFYDDVEDIVPYVCSHECENGCDEEAEIGWPSSGAELVELACL